MIVIEFKDATHSAHIRADAIVAITRLPASVGTFGDVYKDRTKVEYRVAGDFLGLITVDDSDEDYRDNVQIWENAVRKL